MKVVLLGRATGKRAFGSGFNPPPCWAFGRARVGRRAGGVLCFRFVRGGVNHGGVPSRGAGCKLIGAAGAGIIAGVVAESMPCLRVRGHSMPTGAGVTPCLQARGSILKGAGFIAGGVIPGAGFIAGA